MKSLREILPLLDHCTRHSFELIRRHLIKGSIGGGIVAAGSSSLATVAPALADPGGVPNHGGSLVPAAIGGPMPTDRNIISLR